MAQSKNDRAHDILKRLAMGAVMGAFFFLLIGAGFRMQAQRAFDEAMEAQNKGDLALAVVLYDQAIRAHYPFGSVAGSSRDALMKIAGQHEAAGRSDQARQTYQTLLSALCATRTTPDRNDEIERLEQKIKDLMPKSAISAP